MHQRRPPARRSLPAPRPPRRPDIRLITWNCGGALQSKLPLLAAQAPDLVVVPEAERLVNLTAAAGPPASMQWVGNNARKGLGVLAYGDYALAIHPAYDPRHRWIVPLEVTGPEAFLLLATWTAWTEQVSYVQSLVDALETYRPLLAGPQPVVWAGDFNASFALDGAARTTFRKLVAQLAGAGLESVYHAVRGCGHGKEPEATYFQWSRASRGHHVDYVFTGAAMLARVASLVVGRHTDWADASDHVPVVVTFA